MRRRGIRLSPVGSPAEVEGADCSIVDLGEPTENGFATQPVDDQIIEFEFDGAYDLTAAHIWNDNEDGAAEDRGVDEFEIQVNTERTGGTFTAVGTTYNLAFDDGFDNNSAQVIPLVASGVRRVRLLINSAHRGIGGDDEYVGLAEVRFEGTLVTLDLAADGDKNGSVGGGDFLRWQRNLGLGEIENFQVNGMNTFNSTLTATQSEGDYDNNNVINAADLAAWEGTFGSSAPLLSGLASASVPEPATLALGAFAAVGGWFATRRRRYPLSPNVELSLPKT